MFAYKHYIRLNQNNIVIYGFSNGFEQPEENDICIDENAGRHFQIQLRNERGQYLYKWENASLVERTTQELDIEWSHRPPEPPTPEQRIAQLESDNLNLMIALTEVYEKMLGV